MNTIQQQVLDCARDGARQIFYGAGKVQPMVHFFKKGKHGVMLLADFCDESKDKAAAVLKNLRQDCEVVAFINEFWFGHNPSVQPRDDPDRKEALGVILYLPGQNGQLHYALIQRNPNALGPWEEMPQFKGGRFA